MRTINLEGSGSNKFYHAKEASNPFIKKLESLFTANRGGMVPGYVRGGGISSLAPSVIAHALNTPYHMRDGIKHVLKLTFKDLVPQEILDRDKLPLKTKEIAQDKMQKRIDNNQIWQELYNE